MPHQRHTAAPISAAPTLPVDRSARERVRLVSGKKQGRDGRCVQTAVSSVTGGFIQLQFATTADKTGLWTAVQWQDGNKDWHTVEGWQGSFNPDGMVTWWVAPADLGKEPFRWQLSNEESGDLLAVSEAFALPTSEGQVVAVTVEE